LKEEKTVQIIGGIVAYEDGVKTVAGDQFSPTRKVRVELNFSVDQGEDGHAAIQTVLGTAQAFVRTKLGLAPNTGKAADSVEHPHPAQKAAEATAGVSGKEALAKAAGVSEAHVAAATPTPKAPKRTPALKPEAPKPDPAAVIEEAGDPASVEDEFAVAAEEEVKPISDEELNNAVGKKNAKLNNPVLIRSTIAEFKPDGWTKQFTMRDIPQDQRAAFLMKLEALK
jgi:hypothetical protein